MAKKLGSFAELTEWLTAEKVAHQTNAEAQVVEIQTRTPPLDGPVLLRWERNLPFIQVIQLMIPDVPEDRFGAVDTALARINHVIALPGFGLDPDKRFIYFRHTLQLDDDGAIAAAVVARMIRAAVNNGRDFVLALREVSHGGATPETVLALAVSHKLTLSGPRPMA